MSAALWVKVHAIWERGDACGDCPNFRRFTEHHGPGLSEPLSECALIEFGTDPSLCPGLAPEPGICDRELYGMHEQPDNEPRF